MSWEVVIGGSIAPIFYLEDAGAPLIECDVTKSATVIPSRFCPMKAVF
ncbi:MAG: hypothetical protein R2874_10295 [Desulfobacterales bacterium]